MKTLTAFFHLLFPFSRKNSRAVNNDLTPGKRCSASTTIENLSTDMSDAKQGDASFLFFNQAASPQSTVGSLQSPDLGEESKSKEDSDSYRDKTINDELALGNARPIHNNWRERVNDDLAACSTIVIPMVIGTVSVVEARESVTVINDLKNIFPITTVNEKTRTNKNGAWLPFASFCFIRRSLGEGGLFGPSFAEILMKTKADLGQSIRRLFYNAEIFKNQKPVLLTIPIRSRQTGNRNYTDGTKL